MELEEAEAELEAEEVSTYLYNQLEKERDNKMGERKLLNIVSKNRRFRILDF